MCIRRLILKVRYFLCVIKKNTLGLVKLCLTKALKQNCKSVFLSNKNYLFNLNLLLLYFTPKNNYIRWIRNKKNHYY